MKIVGIIPARFESSRFPGKPLIDLKGKTMIQRVYESAKKSEMLNELIVATDDQRIVDVVTSFGGKAELTSDSHPSGTDRCAEVAKRHAGYDVVLNIQGDEPLVDHRQIDQLLNIFHKPETQIGTLGIREQDKQTISNSNRIKIVVNHEKKALYFSRSTIPNYDNFKGNPFAFYPFMRHIGLYAYRSEILQKLTELLPTKLEKIESLEQLRWMYYGYEIQVVETDIETPNIDVPEDVKKVLNLIK